MVDVDQLLASEEQFLLAEAQAMERMCSEALAGQEVRAWAGRAITFLCPPWSGQVVHVADVAGSWGLDSYSRECAQLALEGLSF